MCFFLVKELPDGFPKTTKSPTPQQIYKKQYYGTNITLQCDATNNPDIRWFLEYIPLDKKIWKEGEGFEYKISADKRTLLIYNLRKVEGFYILCFVANNIGIDQGGRYRLDTIPVPSKYNLMLTVFLSVLRNTSQRSIMQTELAIGRIEYNLKLFNTHANN